jgi:hypothetical protein
MLIGKIEDRDTVPIFSILNFVHIPIRFNYSIKLNKKHLTVSPYSLIGFRYSILNNKFNDRYIESYDEAKGRRTPNLSFGISTKLDKIIFINEIDFRPSIRVPSSSSIVFYKISLLYNFF